VGETVTVKGIVTAKIGKTVYIQDVNGDGDDATSDAISVYGASSVSVGDLVEVTGVVNEYTRGGGSQPSTQIVNPTYTVTATGQALPAPVEIGAGKRLPPTSSIAESIVFWESMESMLVKVLDPIAVAGTTKYGETFVRTGGQITSVSERGTLNIGPGDFNPERIQIDGDGISVDAGATLEDVVGIVSYGFGEYEIVPVGTLDVKTASTLAPTVTSLVNSEVSVLIGSYNVLNLEVVDDLKTGRFALIAQHIVTNMGAPDILGLQEVQDNDGVSGGTGSTVTSASLTLQAIIDEINLISSNFDYQFVDNTLIGDDTNGGQPGGNIRVAFLYNANRVSYDESSLNAVVDPVDQQTNSANPFYRSRLPLAATFSFMGRPIEVVNVHFASKGGSAPLTSSDAQPVEFRQSEADVNGSVDQRIVMSQAIREYASGKDNVVVLGDFNEFEFNLPLINLLDTPLTNLAFTVPAEERYSYIFNGNSQALDHIFVSPALSRLAQLEYIHVNAEFAEKTERASDHDPLVASIIFGPAAIEPVSLGTACNYAILSKSGIQNTPTSDITGNIGVSPITAAAMTGFALTLDAGGQYSTGAEISGEAHGASYAGDIAAALTVAVLDMQAAYTDAASRTTDDLARKELAKGLIGGLTLLPGVYTFTTNVPISEDLYLDALGDPDAVFIIQTTGILTLAANKEVKLLNGAKAKNVFWQVAGNCATGAGSVMRGNLLIFTDVAIGTGATVIGRIYSQTAVALGMATVTPDGDACSA
jgi:endonuclease/exonuclease/phosphatase family metal-dependent hydrolase